MALTLQPNRRQLGAASFGQSSFLAHSGRGYRVLAPCQVQGVRQTDSLWMTSAGPRNIVDFTVTTSIEHNHVT